jgi:ribA/ribD-fused uncharacterized protein
MEPIRFYRAEDAFGCFSNFSPHPIEVDGRVWPTAEHYFQAQKYAGKAKEEQIRRAESPGRAAKMGRAKDGGLRLDWEQAKEAVMAKALRAKFEQHPDLRAVLLGTGDAVLVEHTSNDRYWADGGDGAGKNRLGVLLELLRAELRVEALRVAWRDLLRLPTTSFVLFSRGTCVACASTDPHVSLAQRAVETLGECGAQGVGNPSADFAVQRLGDGRGCLVRLGHPDLLVLMLPEEAAGSDVEVGLRGRQRAALDAVELVIAHVEDSSCARSSRTSDCPPSLHAPHRPARANSSTSPEPPAPSRRRARSSPATRASE